MSSQESIRVSVVIPCFNDGEFIQEAIASVETCSDPIYEIIIINDGSKDTTTLNILNKLKSKGYQVIDRENGGPGAARNTGIRIAQGEYILSLDADCRIRSAYITRSIEILDREPDVAVVYGDVELFGEQTSVRQVPELILSSLVNHNYIDNCAVFRKSVWKDCGFYDEKMPFFGFEDWDLWLSIAKRKHKFYHIPEVLFEYRVRSVCLSTAGRGEEKAKLMSQYIAFKHAAFFPKEYRFYYRKILRKWLKFWEKPERMFEKF